MYTNSNANNHKKLTKMQKKGTTCVPPKKAQQLIFLIKTRMSIFYDKIFMGGKYVGSSDMSLHKKHIETHS